MVRSLYCGISGLRNHQVGMDVTGNNIANVNTVGFKAGRVTYKESMAQMLKGASRPPGNAGGTNPMQVGLGMAIGSIDTILIQGNLQSTGQITDLALEGNAYFAFSNGEGRFFSRNGGLQMDANGKLVSPTNGFVLQGMMAAPDGTFPIGTRIGDLRIPYGEKAPAKSTEEVSYACNLDSDSEGLGTIVHSNRYLANADAADTISGLFDESGNDLGIQVGDVITVSASDNVGNDYTQSLTVATGDNLATLLNSIQTVVASIDPLNMVTMNLDGTISVTTNNNVNSSILNLQVRSNNPISDSYVANAFSYGPVIPASAGILGSGVPAAVSAGALRAAATDTDLLSAIYDAAGNSLGLEDDGVNPDQITIAGGVGGSNISVPAVDYDVAMTVGDLLNEIQSAFRLPQYDGTVNNNLSVSINTADTDDDRIPDGAITIRGQRGTAFALTNLSLSASNGNNNPTAPTRFNANMGLTEIQTARDVGQQSTSIVVYDESGDSHTMTTTFTNSGIPGEWLWRITTDGGEQILGGNSGRITFGQDGSPSSMQFDDGSTGFSFDPMNGSNEVRINLDVGSPGSFRGITQFRSPSTTAARSQDGYPMGKLQEISIDEYGEIKGLYTNGISKAIARIYLAEFNNPAGLYKRGDSMFSESNNSGNGVMLQAGVGTSTKIKPGALEMSNVELATEFTNMITTQRGYQANARVITTSDNMLQELVQLIR